MARTKEFNEIEILDKAIDLFWFKGYNGASMQDVVDSLGLSRSSIYDTFGDKHQLYISALEQYRKQAAGGLIDMVKQSVSPLQTIQQLLEMLANDSLNPICSKGCFMTNSTIELAPHDPEIHKIVKDNMQDIEEAFYNLVKKGQDLGEITNQNDARALASFLFNTISGIRVAAKSGANKAVYQDIIDVTLSALR
ncbi:MULTISPECIES: TetR/AcrR family transcriptional regulator [unclassified Arcicella]|uniref:TetR/AcrR family transcriptional regulator n=1 Tax=unclassified Arcicella TaxID=2644986 RepID=UPI002864394E|nr:MULTISPECIES: TetR/AcrR family transcriptional regulator [unclassified Arcicella]MDR6560185.1 TetR/AcrR family transcriptional repressor of nem operon [Arcicella sp. BE51]MDR6810208.1 TetR/AcrR family transcriptional repressor of nem operon [Arcicella sp. BE140]MDR6821558.1 TetR/AcrR family transcriptional repressor of nem operon [Arcicella sp. BE139]